MLARVRRTHEAGRPGIEEDRRVGRARAAASDGDAFDAVGARRERVGQLAGHGDDVALGAVPIRAFASPNAWCSALEPGAQRRRRSGGLDDPAVFGARGLEMHAADIPADDDVHACAIPIARMIGSTYTLAVSVCTFAAGPDGDHSGYRPQGRTWWCAPAWASATTIGRSRRRLSPTSDPVDVTRGLLSVYPFATLYVADLDAIERRGDNSAALIRLKAACPGVSFWVDNGIAEASAARDGSTPAWVDLVLGSETQRDGALVRGFADDPRHPVARFSRTGVSTARRSSATPGLAGPAQSSSMTLARVGSGAGPDLDRLAAVRQRCGGTPDLRRRRRARCRRSRRARARRHRRGAGRHRAP